MAPQLPSHLLCPHSRGKGVKLASRNTSNMDHESYPPRGEITTIACSNPIIHIVYRIHFLLNKNTKGKYTQKYTFLIFLVNLHGRRKLGHILSSTIMFTRNWFYLITNLLTIKYVLYNFIKSGKKAFIRLLSPFCCPYNFHTKKGHTHTRNACDSHRTMEQHSTDAIAMTQQVHLWNGHKAKPGKMGRDIGYSRCFFRLNPKMCTFFVQTPKVVGNTWFDELIYDYLLMNLARFTWQYDAMLNNCKAFLWERVPENKLQGTQSGEFDLSWLWQQTDPLRTFNCQCVSFWEKCSARWACWCFQIFHGSMTSWGC